jgi:hypothetical protein
MTNAMMLNSRAVRGLLASIAILATASACGDVVRQGRSPVVLVVDSLQAAAGGAASATFSTVLHSDVITNVTSPAPCTPAAPCPTVFSDTGQGNFHLDSKDISIAPTANNQVTITRVRIVYRRADGRNTPGVDVPYSFDQTVTLTVPPDKGATVLFEIVRHAAKEESPLVQLIANPNIINVIADVTFYGADQVGNDVSATSSMSIEFGNFGDQR